MTKIQHMLTSLVAVIPGALLLYLLVMALLTQSENLSTMAYIVMGVTLLSMVVTLLIPAGILVGGRRKPASSAAAAKSSKAVIKQEDSSGDIEALDDDVEVYDEPIDGSEDGDLVIGTNEFDLGESDDNMPEIIDDDLDTEPVEEFEGFDIDEEEEVEEEPKPKKKKR